MKIRYLLVLLVLFSALSACAELSRPRLLKDPILFSGGAIDAVKLALFHQYGSLRDLVDSPRYSSRDRLKDPFPLCNAAEIRRINSKMIQQQCAVSYPFLHEACLDAKGCIRLSFHPDIYGDIAMRNLIIDTINNPCLVVPPLPVGQYDEHWHGMGYTLRGIRGSLDCDRTSGLPYQRAVLKFGEHLIYQ